MLIAIGLGWVVLSLAGFKALDSGEEVERYVAAYRVEQSPVARVVAITELAELGTAAANAEDRVAVAELLAEAVKDESHVVRGVAILLVAQSPEREIALEALLRGLRVHQRELKAYRKRQARLAPGKMRGHRGRDPLNESLRKIQEDVNKATESLEALIEFMAENEGLTGLTDVYVRAFAGIPDDRSIRGLESLLELKFVGDSMNGIQEALLALGTSRSLAVSIESLTAYEARRRELEKQVREIERERPRPVPAYWKGTDKQWRTRERERIDKRAGPARERVAELDAWAQTLRDRWVRFAEAKGLAAPPVKLLPKRHCRNWARKVGRELPGSLDVEETDGEAGPVSSDDRCASGFGFP